MYRIGDFIEKYALLKRIVDIRFRYFISCLEYQYKILSTVILVVWCCNACVKKQESSLGQ